MEHYLQVTDRQFSEAAGVAQGVAPAQVIGNQGISENSPTLKNKAFPVIDHHDLSQEMPEWAMRDSNPRHLRCKRLKVYKYSGFVTFYVVTVLQKIASICNRLHCVSTYREGNVVQVVRAPNC